jgi:hypothetical protein
VTTGGRPNAALRAEPIDDVRWRWPSRCSRLGARGPAARVRARRRRAVNVSIKNGNVPIVGLKASDFRVLDNGVPQTISDLSVEGVPIDLTLFFDTSTSFIGNLGDLKAGFQKIAVLLRPGDRLRLLAFDDEVEELVHWTDAGVTLDLAGLHNARR